MHANSSDTNIQSMTLRPLPPAGDTWCTPAAPYGTPISSHGLWVTHTSLSPSPGTVSDFPKVPGGCTDSPVTPRWTLKPSGQHTRWPKPAHNPLTRYMLWSPHQCCLCSASVPLPRTRPHLPTTLRLPGPSGPVFAVYPSLFCISHPSLCASNWGGGFGSPGGLSHLQSLFNKVMHANHVYSSH